MDRSGRKLVKTWRPGLFEIQDKDGYVRTVKGHVRGSLGLDRRLIECKGYGDYYYNREMWCLTHVPTRSLVLSRKHRNEVEEIADRLRAEVPELTDGELTATEISQETLERASIVVQDRGSED